MKYTLPIVVLLLSYSIAGNAQFGPAIYIDSFTAQNAKQIVASDQNGDGIDDLLVTVNSWPQDKLVLYTTSSGPAFTPGTLVTMDNAKTLESVSAGDVNNDGKEDFAISYGLPSVICWYENKGGSYVRRVVDSNLDWTQKVILSDFDNDGYADLLSLQHSEVVLYRYSPSAGFQPGKVIHSGTEFYSIAVGDFNGDIFKDIAIGSFGFEIFSNDGTGNYVRIAAAGSSLCMALNAADLDKDGDADMMTYEPLKGLVRYENNGSALFTYKDVSLPSTDKFEYFSIHDLDQDGRNDVFTTLTQSNKAIWLKNDGTGAFGAPDSIHRQPGDLLAASTLADLNKDGKMDAVWGGVHMAAHLNIFPTVSIPEKSNSVNITVSPNPTQESITISNDNNQAMEMQLCDITGRTIIRLPIPAHTAQTAALPRSGLYIAQFRDEKGVLLSAIPVTRL